MPLSPTIRGELLKRDLQRRIEEQQPLATAAAVALQGAVRRRAACKLVQAKREAQATAAGHQRRRAVANSAATRIQARARGVAGRVRAARAKLNKGEHGDRGRAKSQHEPRVKVASAKAYPKEAPQLQVGVQDAGKLALLDA